MEFLDGMTVNERLFALKKMDSFDQAIVSGNKEVAIKILEACELSNETAKSVSNIKLLATIYILVLGIYAYSLANLSLYEYFPGFVLGALPIIVLLWPLLLLLFKKLLGKG